MPNGYEIGGRHIHDFRVEMTGMPNVPVMPPFANQSETQGGRDGGWDFGIQYEPKIITVDHYIWTEARHDTQNLARSLAGHLNPRKGSQILIFDHEPDKMYYARLNDQMNVEEIIKLFNTFTLEYICFDPFTYSVKEYTQNVTTTPVIDHKGTHVSKPILVIDHRGGPDTITCTPQDGVSAPMSVSFEATTPSGQFIIDMKAGTVVFNGGSGDKYIKSLTWIEMPPGPSRYTHGGNITRVTAKYRDTWL